MSQLLQRSYYQASASEFMEQPAAAILCELVASHTFDTDVLQRVAWQHQIEAIKRILPSLPSADIHFESVLPLAGGLGCCRCAYHPDAGVIQTGCDPGGGPPAGHDGRHRHRTRSQRTPRNVGTVRCCRGRGEVDPMDVKPIMTACRSC